MRCHWERSLRMPQACSRSAIGSPGLERAAGPGPLRPQGKPPRIRCRTSTRGRHVLVWRESLPCQCTFVVSHRLTSSKVLMVLKLGFARPTSSVELKWPPLGLRLVLIPTKDHKREDQGASVSRFGAHAAAVGNLGSRPNQRRRLEYRGGRA